LKVLFVSSGNKKEAISSLVYDQGESIKSIDVDLTYYTIRGKGILGYLNNIFLLRKYLKKQKFDVVHAHYSLSGFVAALSGAKPMVVSLMGSDVKAKAWFRLPIFLFYRFFWAQTIAKSEDMKNSLGFKNIIVIPNGVDFNRFYPMNKTECQSKLKWDTNKKHILFPSNPNRPEKNYKLLIEALKFLYIEIELHTLVDVPHNKVPMLINASDVVVLTSLWEGSPNVIKEAMACNIPIVATDVGDVRKNINNLEGCYISTYEPADVAENIKKALTFNLSTKGKQRIIELGLDSETIANKIIDIYKNTLNGIY